MYLYLYKCGWAYAPKAHPQPYPCLRPRFVFKKKLRPLSLSGFANLQINQSFFIAFGVKPSSSSQSVYSRYKTSFISQHLHVVWFWSSQFTPYPFMVGHSKHIYT